MADTDVDVMEALDENPSMEGAAEEGEGDVVHELERKEGPLHEGQTQATEEEFTEGVVKDGFGLLMDEYDDYQVDRYTFTNKHGMTAQVISYGVTVMSIRVPDKKGVFDDVALGFDSFNDYLIHKNAYIGSTIGRVCNRVSGGKFLLGSRVNDLTKNVEGKWQLHGGFKGLSFVLWKSQIKGKHVVFSYMSPSGEEGYPGNLMIQIEVWLTDDNGLKMVATATTDRDTPISLTNHTYFNLAGHWSGPEGLGEHVIVVNADKYLDCDDNMIPTGEIKHVGTTDLDLRIPRLLSRLIPVVPKGGFDHNYCINGGKQDGVRFVARLIHPKTGRVMEVFSDQPCAVVYTSRNLPAEDEMEEFFPSNEDIESHRSYASLEGEERKPHTRKKEMVGKNGALYLKYGAICVEPQGYPDAVNKPHFPDVILHPGETYTHTMIFKFSTLVRTKSIRIEAETNGPELRPERHSFGSRGSPRGSIRSNDAHNRRHSGDSRQSQRSLERGYSGDVPTINLSHENQAARASGYADNYDDY